MLYDPLIYGPKWSVGGITFNDSTDAFGCDWILTSGSGWFGKPAPKAVRADKPASRGAYAGDEFPGARVVSLGGTLAAPDISTLRDAITRLTGICESSSQLYPLQCTDETGLQLTSQVRLDGEIITDPVAARSVAFSLQLYAPDPRKLSSNTKTSFSTLATPGTGGVSYSPGVNYNPGVNYGVPGTPGAVSATNAGNAPADMVITFTGPLTNPSLYNFATSDYITYTGVIAAGTTVVINTQTGSVISGNASRRNLLSVSKWPVIPAKGTLNLAFQTGNPSDTGNVSISYTDTYY